MNENVQMQSRNKSALFWIGLIAAVYQAVYGSITMAEGITLPPVALAVLGSISVALSALLIYCNGNNPSLTIY